MNKTIKNIIVLSLGVSTMIAGEIKDVKEWRNA